MVQLQILIVLWELVQVHLDLVLNRICQAQEWIQVCLVSERIQACLAPEQVQEPGALVQGLKVVQALVPDPAVQALALVQVVLVPDQVERAQVQACKSARKFSR